MSNVRFFSDPHFDHHNMAIKRGFENSDEMNKHIIDKWNSVVNKKDTTFILGDITMEKNSYEILNSLNGIKRIVLGNHDDGNHSKHLQLYVNSIAGMVNYKNMILSHCPIHPNELNYRFTHNIHGHVHENSIDDSRYINVCAEVIDYTPKILNEILKVNL